MSVPVFLLSTLLWACAFSECDIINRNISLVTRSASCLEDHMTSSFWYGNSSEEPFLSLVSGTLPLYSLFSVVHQKQNLQNVKKRLFFLTVLSSDRSRISQGGRQSHRRRLPIIWHNFCWKLHENEKNGLGAFFSPLRLRADVGDSRYRWEKTVKTIVLSEMKVLVLQKKNCQNFHRLI